MHACIALHKNSWVSMKLEGDVMWINCSIKAINSWEIVANRAKKVEIQNYFVLIEIPPIDKCASTLPVLLQTIRIFNKIYDCRAIFFVQPQRNIKCTPMTFFSHYIFRTHKCIRIQEFCAEFLIICFYIHFVGTYCLRFFAFCLRKMVGEADGPVCLFSMVRIQWFQTIKNCHGRNMAINRRKFLLNPIARMNTMETDFPEVKVMAVYDKNGNINFLHAIEFYLHILA